MLVPEPRGAFLEVQMDGIFRANMHAGIADLAFISEMDPAVHDYIIRGTYSCAEPASGTGIVHLVLSSRLSPEKASLYHAVQHGQSRSLRRSDLADILDPVCDIPAHLVDLLFYVLSPRSVDLMLYFK